MEPRRYGNLPLRSSEQDTPEFADVRQGVPGRADVLRQPGERQAGPADRRPATPSCPATSATAIAKVLQGAGHAEGRRSTRRPSKSDQALPSDEPTTVTDGSRRSQRSAAAPPRAATPAGPRSRRRAGAGASTGWAFAGPATLIVVGLSIFPAVWAFLISRHELERHHAGDAGRAGATTS